jgi:hypothetical protein
VIVLLDFPIRLPYETPLQSWTGCRSTVVVHSLGKGEVISSILIGSTSFFNDLAEMAKSELRATCAQTGLLEVSDA